MAETKRQILRDSVKKLLDLNISDREILLNLRDVGIDEKDAKDVLEETKKELAGKGKAKEEKEESDRDKSEQPESYEELLESIAEDREKEKKSPKREQPEEKLYVKEFKETPQVMPSTSEDIAKLWEKGVLATVDARLSEMQELKDGLDEKIDGKIKEGLEKEIKRVQVIYDSQKTLLIDKVNSSLEQRGRELTDAITARFSELKKISDQAEKNLSKLDTEKRGNEELMGRLNERMKGLQAETSRATSDANASIIKSQSRLEGILRGYEAKQADLEARINRTLQLESKIAEGLIEDAKQKIDKLELEKSDELAGQVKKMVDELKKTKDQVDVESIQKKMDDLERMKADIEKLNKLQLGELKKLSETQLNDLFRAQKAGWANEFKHKEKEIDELAAKINLEEIKATMQELDVFKQQFIKVIEKNVAEFNRAKKEMVEHMQKRDNSAEERIKAIDMKMVELTEFEENFASEMGLNIDKLVTVPAPEKAQKKAKKKK